LLLHLFYATVTWSHLPVDADTHQYIHSLCHSISALSLFLVC
jgi:hypothetical protein